MLASAYDVPAHEDNVQLGALKKGAQLPLSGTNLPYVAPKFGTMVGQLKGNAMSLDVTLTVMQPAEVYWRNITHNLNAMAQEAGIYQHLWRPDELGITKAAELIEPLRTGLALLQSDPDRFKAFDAPNGWGRYENLVEFVADYLAGCEQNPAAEVNISR